jgi:large subunit ribosomal protein L11
VTVFNDRSFEFEIKSSPASVLIKEAAGIEKGSGEPNSKKVGKITMSQCRKIAEEKGADINSHDLDAGALIIAGTARSMGVDVVEG